jgi:signal transduction histidine kinase
METELFSKGNESGVIVIFSIFLMLFMSIVLLLFFFFSKKKIIQKELEKKDIELNHQKLLLQATLQVQEEERQRIARDLHDDISSKLNIVSLNCHLLSMGDLEKEKENETINNIIDLSSKALENSRRIAHDLFPPVFDKFGLDAGIEELCSEFNSCNRVVVNYKNEVTFNEEEKNRHLHVFRILQELMNNSLRHGKASSINILFKDDNGKTMCHYNDNGKGFNVKSDANMKGIGMKNIESRVNYLNGGLTINSKINKGTEIIFNF